MNLDRIYEHRFRNVTPESRQVVWNEIAQYIVVAYFTFKLTGDWRLCYKIGGGLGIMLLLLRVKVAESGLFKQVKNSDVRRGDFTMFFTKASRFKKYILSILIGLPTWYVIGIVVNQSDKFAEKLYGS